MFVFSRSVYQAPGILIKSIFKSQRNEIKIWPTIWLHWNNRHVFYHLLNVTICNSIIEVSLLYRELHTCNVDNSMSLYTDACDTIATIRVTDTSNTSQSFLVSLWFSFVVRTLPVRCTFVRNADVHTTILLTRGVCCTQDRSPVPPQSQKISNVKRSPFPVLCSRPCTTVKCLSNQHMFHLSLW